MLVLLGVTVSFSTVVASFSLVRADERPVATETTTADASPDTSTTEPAKPARPRAHRLPDTVVTATRDERVSALVPFATGALAPQEGRRGHDRTLPEALEALPGVHIQKTGPGQSSAYVRGLTGYHTLVLVDGIRLNNSTFRAGPNQYLESVDIFLADRIELVRGPGTVLYGGDAVAGTLQVFTRRPPPATEGALPVGGRALYRFASAERSHVTRLEGWGRAGPVAAIAGFSWKHYGDLDASGDGRLPNTGYAQRDADGKFEWSVSDALTLTAAAQFSDVLDAPRTHSTDAAVPYRGSRVGTDQRRDLGQRRVLGYVDAHLDLRDQEGAWVDEARVTLSYHRQRERERRVRQNGRTTNQGFSVGAYGAQLALARETPIGRLTLGADHYHDRVDSDRRDSQSGIGVQGPVGDRGRYDLLGIYLQDAIALGDVADVIVGGRYTYARARVGRAQDPVTGEAIRLDDAWHDVSGSARVMVHLFEHVHPFVGLSQGFRAPNLSDLSRLDSARSGELEVVSPDLEPERFVSLEAGIKLSFDRLHVQATWFYTWIRDLIVRRPTGAVIDGELEVVKANAGDGYTTGVEAEVVFDVWEGISIYAGGFYMNGRAKAFPTSDPVAQTEVIDRLQPAQITLGARWQSEDGRFFVDASARLVRHQRRLSTRDREDDQRIPANGTPSYVVLGIRGSAQLFEHMRVFGAVENLADRRYRVHGSGQNAPGTNAVVGLELSF